MIPLFSPTSDRAAGSIVGAFIGDALGLGPHWYYNLDELRRDYGTWIDGYTTPKPASRYHVGMKAGELSQSGIIMLHLLRSLAERGLYDEADFTHRLDTALLPQLNGTPHYGPGGFTNHSIRQVWHNRVQEGRPWGETGGNADTTEAAERVGLLGARYSLDPAAAARHAFANCQLSQTDSLVAQHSVAFACVVGQLVQGVIFDSQLSGKLMPYLGDGRIPFVAKTSLASAEDPKSSFGFASPDALLLPSWIAQASQDPGIQIEPPWKVSLVYGMACSINSVLPAAYYLTATFPNDFESAVLHAINGGGQNMSRACLTGALVGAQTGLSGIPQRFIDGLIEGPEIVHLARQVAQAASQPPP